MEAIVGILNLVALLVFYFGLSAFLVQASRLPGARRGLVLVLGALVLAPVILGELIYAGVPMACGVGLAFLAPCRLSRARRFYVLTVGLAIVLILLDFVYDSGIPRFGLPSLDQLFNPELVWHSTLEALIGATVVGVAALVIFGLVWLLVGVFTGKSGGGPRARRRLIAFAVASFLCYLVEPQLHGNIHHPLLVHHPFFTLSTFLGALVGYVALRESISVLAIFDPYKPLAFPIVVYFALYHFGLEVYERTAGWMFDMPYSETAAVTFTLTLPYGVLLRQLVLATGREGGSPVPG